jgi:myo-inositol-1(or 4)-monophosphatase
MDESNKVESGAIPAELLALAVSVSHEAATFLSTRPSNFDIHQKSSAVDFATQMDHASEKLIVERLLAARPDDGIIGEEGAERESSSGITWVIDPLDGTVNYFYDLPGWNVSIAAKDSEGVVIGVVNAPSINSLWTAIRGGGAFKNGEPIRCTNPVALDRALLGTGFSYSAETRVGQAELVESLIPRIRDLRRNGAAAVDLCQVATGALDGYFEKDLKEWDLAAGGLIATEAGALVTGRNGGAPGQEMVIAAGPALHAHLLSEIG